MVLEHYSTDKLKKEVRQVVGKYLDLAEFQLFFFGSRVDGSSHATSDIDIGIEGNKLVDWQKISRIKEEFYEMPILYKIDVIDFKSVSDKFYQFAKTNIELI